MMRARTSALIVALLVACQTGIVHAGDLSPAEPVHELRKKKMKTDEPMETGMMKKGMTKGDVKKAADEKARELQPMMEQEEKTMPAGPEKR
ncbi:hypothetical protein [Azoarcus sp. KH32C]|uniref:hypothetical protein n=1 Tax=Azoarcus sp. KH32C TaxID=748247 RepID=UPI0002385F16|nr:hypothetical protein [Azoarcus sp. KH32C]BAL25598.1 hypothetical protein AZKH_3309 [Azoarcus sp. KH32C]